MISRLVFVIFCAAPVLASATQLVETHDDWRVFQTEESDKNICYIGSVPIKKEGNYTKRGKAYLLVMHKQGNQDEISVSSGYPYKENESVKLTIGQRAYDLFSKGELAWAFDAKADRAMVKDMIRGKDLVVRGTSWKGTSSKDTYSLKGFTAAHRKMKQLCE